MIEYYLAMLIFLFMIVSIGYFMYRWYEAVQDINQINLNAPQGIGEANVVLTALASLHQPCVLTTEDAFNSNSDPICNSANGLTCVTGMYVGNGEGTNTGVCLSNIGGYCDTIYDCVPSADACINSICENMTETINLPCTYDSDCIGGSTCTHCITGTGPCKDISTGQCSELVNGECSTGLSLCNMESDTNPPIQNLQGEFRYNHVCDTSLPQPLCKYNFSPKDQGCTTDSDCVQPDGGAFCYTGSFKTDTNPDGKLIPPTYSLKGIESASNDTVIIEIDFGDTLVTTNSFEKGTEVNFVQTDVTRTTISDGPYYIRDQIDNSFITLMANKYQPDITEYVQFPNKYIQLNESSYTTSDAFTDPDKNLTIPENLKIVFGKLPPLQIISTCYYDSTNDNFVLVDTQPNTYIITGDQPQTPFTNNQHVTIQYTNQNIVTSNVKVLNDTYTIAGFLPSTSFENNETVTIKYNTSDSIQANVNTKYILIDNINVETGTTQVRFELSASSSTTFQSFTNSKIFTLSTIVENGTAFTVSEDTTDLQSYDSDTNTINVQFGLPTNVDILNENKGVCVMKLPPSASVSTDSKYDLTDYAGNPCIDLYDNGIIVSTSEGYCKFQNSLSGPGSVCQFSRPSVDGTNGIVNPLPCSNSTTIYEGDTYDLTCLINDNLTETVRNNPNFLNSSYAGVCAYPVHNKFKGCELYNNNCRPPYVCTEFQGGFFCDSRFDILQCNNVYKCPPTYTCVDGACLGTPSQGFCSQPQDCSNTNCDYNKLVLGFYNSTLDTKTTTSNTTAIPNQLITLTNLDISGNTAKDYDLYVSSSYDNNVLTTFAFIYYSENTHELVKIVDPLGTPSTETISLSDSVTLTSGSKFIFDHKNQKLYSYNLNESRLNLNEIYPTPTSYSFNVTGNVLDIDINDSNLLVTSKQNVPGPEFINLDLPTNAYILFETSQDQNFYIWNDTTTSFIQKINLKRVLYFESKPSSNPPSNQDYIVNGSTTNNGYYQYNTDNGEYIFSSDGDSNTVYITTNQSPTQYYLWDTSFINYSIELVKYYDSMPNPAPSSSYIVNGSTSTDNGWYYGGLTTKNIIPTPSSPDNKQKYGYVVNLFKKFVNTAKTYKLPYYPEALDNLDVCKFDFLNVNDTELDVVCLYNPENFQSPVLGVRNKVREFSASSFSSLGTITGCNGSPEQPLGCFLNPTISALTSVTTLPTGITGSNIYQVTNPVDVNTIYAFSNGEIKLSNVTVNTIYKSKNSLYLDLDLDSKNSLGSDLTSITLTPTLGNDYAPFSFTPSSNLDNYGNVLSTYLEYPYWIDDLQDLIVGDSFNPKIKRIFYQPDRVNRNFYAIVDMYTGFDNPVENKLIEDEISDIENQNMYLFKFSSLDNEIGLTVNETLPIRISGPSDIRRFSQCNQTQNMFFVSNKCSTSS